MSTLVDTLNMELAEKWWITTTDKGNRAFPLRSDKKRGYPPPGTHLVIEDVHAGNSTWPRFSICKGRSMVWKFEGKSAEEIRRGVGQAAVYLNKYGVPKGDS